MNRKRLVRFGIAGLGVHGLRYARHLFHAEVPRGLLAAVCRRGADAARDFAEEAAADLHADWREMVRAPGVDAVVVATPPDSHAEIAIGAARAGKHVLVEKPMAASAAECRAMIAAAREAGVVLAAAHTLRWERTVRALRAEIARAGPPLTMSLVHRLEPRRVRSGAAPPPDWDSALFETGIHLLDAARFLSGREIAEVSAEPEPPPPLGRELAAATLRMAGGTVCLLEASCLSSARTSRIEALWPDRQLAADLILGTLAERRGRETRPLPVPDAPWALVAAMEDFAGAILERRAPAVPGEEGLRALEAAEACLRSARAGRPAAPGEGPS